jgi:hypothetical protein
MRICRVRLAGAAFFLILGAAPAWPGVVAWTPSWCLPPIFEGGERLHALPMASVFWLPPLLRQHQLCHAARSHPDELRAIVIGSSGVLGFPLLFDETFTARLNEYLSAHGVAARVFNLGFLYPYELRDALVLRAALDYRPDLIVYAVTLADFPHQAPFPFPAIRAFFEANDTAVHELARAGVPGLEEPIRRYDAALVERTGATRYWGYLQVMGALARAAAHDQAEALALWVDPATRPATSSQRQNNYDCNDTLAHAIRLYKNWQDWNIFAYLQQVHETSGVPVLVMSLPIAHEPIGKCYNVRYPSAAVERFNRWVQAECDARDFGYIDLHDLLPAQEFLDPLHPSAEGHRRIAEQLAPRIETLLRERAAARVPAVQ